MHEPQETGTRRDFLRRMAQTAACGTACWGLQALWTPEARADTRRNWYRDHEKEYLEQFKREAASLEPVLRGRFGETLTREMIKVAGDRFAALLPDLPNVGGDRNPLLKFVPVMAWFLAFYEVVRPHGGTPEFLGRAIYDSHCRLLAEQAEEMKAKGRTYFTTAMYRDLERWTSESQQMALPGNWVMTFVPGDGKTYDFGLDFTECACVKFLGAHGVPELAPFMCVNDFPMSRAMDTGLVLEHTLAMGAPKCDFRYKQGRPVRQGWDTEIEAIRKRVKQIQSKA